VVRASCCQCQRHHSPGFDPSILRHSGISGEADEAVLDYVREHKKKKRKKSTFFKIVSIMFKLRKKNIDISYLLRFESQRTDAAVKTSI
jgi:hypothetical protein